MNKFLLDIITPTREVFKEEVEAVSVPTASGIIQVLSHHEPLFSALTTGEIKIDAGSRELFLAIGGGFMEVNGNHVEILVSRAVHADELNETEIKKAHENAKTALAQKPSGQALIEAHAVLRQSLVELKVLRRMQKKSHQF